VNTARCFPRDARRNAPTLMIFTDDLENIAEPNHNNAQQNLRFPMPMTGTILTIFKEPSEDDSTNKRFNSFIFFILLFFLSSFLYVILLMSSEAEVGSAEEQPAKE
jgi:hypothetical protein